MKLQSTGAFTFKCKHIIVKMSYIPRVVHITKVSVTFKLTQGHWYSCHLIGHI